MSILVTGSIAFASTESDQALLRKYEIAPKTNTLTAMARVELSTLRARGRNEIRTSRDDLKMSIGTLIFFLAEQGVMDESAEGFLGEYLAEIRSSIPAEFDLAFTELKDPSEFQRLIEKYKGWAIARPKREGVIRVVLKSLGNLALGLVMPTEGLFGPNMQRLSLQMNRFEAAFDGLKALRRRIPSREILKKIHPTSHVVRFVCETFLETP